MSGYMRVIPKDEFVARMLADQDVRKHHRKLAAIKAAFDESAYYSDRKTRFEKHMKRHGNGR